ncbi:hypothetical protein BO83DRAFT_461429 [Aspergillus eucalypticola CBS 122712]|uniref:Uncharacterized protein n=1 Tax=Aspergillus eucalypticola (strain CBS 122712 / IBT 29274) TaxID=1448314 RepID=A0A317VXF1_ASPEC|nr:uncharacterized protein BO83DRAFT_461429 [Aspergillus eucalypticola CBS 122712]PWY79106.1 hypothetical protein BO83DRAFT_461429 [Aspergillus eucalypticola CBS 122712]
MDYPRQFLWMCWMATQEGGRWEDDGTSVARAESDGKGKEKDGRKAGQPPPPRLARCDAKDVNEKGRCVEKGIQVYSMTPRPPLSNPDGIADWEEERRPETLGRRWMASKTYRWEIKPICVESHPSIGSDEMRKEG